MRTALLIGLMVLGAAGAAAAQGGYKPYQPRDYGAAPPAPRDYGRDPYDLPKAYHEDPYGRDFSTNRDSNAYVNTRRDRNDDGYSPGGYSSGSSSRGASSRAYPGMTTRPSYGSNRSSTGSNRDTSRCRAGLVC